MGQVVLPQLSMYRQVSTVALTWCDAANFAFTTSSLRKIFNLSASTSITSIATPTDGSLTSNTCVDGMVGPLWRTKLTTTGTYAGGTTIAVDAYFDGSLVQVA